MKAPDNPVANFDPSNSFADRRDLAGAVGQRHYANLCWTATTPFEDHQIAVVKRARADPHSMLDAMGAQPDGILHRLRVGGVRHDLEAALAADLERGAYLIV